MGTDDATAVSEAVRYLAVLGHRRIARVGGPAGLGHSAIRTEASERAVAELGLDRGVPVESGIAGEERARATRSLLLASDRPTAVVHDDHVMAAAGVRGHLTTRTTRLDGPTPPVGGARLSRVTPAGPGRMGAPPRLGLGLHGGHGATSEASQRLAQWIHEREQLTCGPTARRMGVSGVVKSV